MVDSVGGVLLMQDVQLGTLMALLPFFEDEGDEDGDPAQSFWLSGKFLWFLQLLQVVFGLPVVVLVLRSAGTRIIGKYHRYVP